MTDTIAWFPGAPFKMPGSSPFELATAAITDLSSAMRALIPTATDGQHHLALTNVETATAVLTELVQIYQPQNIVPIIAHPPTSSTPVVSPEPILPVADQRVSPDMPPPGLLPLHKQSFPPASSTRMNIFFCIALLQVCTTLHHTTLYFLTFN